MVKITRYTKIQDKNEQFWINQISQIPKFCFRDYQRFDFSFKRHYKKQKQKKNMKFSIRDFFSKCFQFPADLVTFTEEILKEKLHFCAVRFISFRFVWLILTMTLTLLLHKTVNCLFWLHMLFCQTICRSILFIQLDLTRADLAGDDINLD